MIQGNPNRVGEGVADTRSQSVSSLIRRDVATGHPGKRRVGQLSCVTGAARPKQLPGAQSRAGRAMVPGCEERRPSTRFRGAAQFCEVEQW